VIALSAIAAFATIVTLGLPYMKGDALEGRMKAVAERRDELRQKQREAFRASQPQQGTASLHARRLHEADARQSETGEIAESPGMKEKLARAGYRGQGRSLRSCSFAS